MAQKSREVIRAMPERKHSFFKRCSLSPSVRHTFGFPISGRPFCKAYFSKVYFPKVHFLKVYFPKVYFPKVYLS